MAEITGLFSWDAPLVYTDGSQVDPVDISRYEVYQSIDSLLTGNEQPVITQNLTEYNFTLSLAVSPNPYTLYFAVKCVTVAGEVSALSQTASQVIKVSEQIIPLATTAPENIQLTINCTGPECTTQQDGSMEVFEGLPQASGNANYTGTFAHGNTVTITGSGFGTKPTQAAPLLWDTVDNQSGYSALNDGDTITTSVWGQNANNNIKYSTSSTQRHSNSTAQYRGVVPADIGEPWIYQLWLEEPAGFTSPWGFQNDKIYISHWFKSSINPENISNGNNTKLYRVFGDSPGLTERVSILLDHCYTNDGSDWGGSGRYWTATSSGYYTHQGWNRLELSVDYGGLIEFRINCVVPNDENTNPMSTNPVFSSATGHPLPSLGLDVSNGDALAIMEGAELLMSDIYMDDSFARVEVGDNISYDSCTIREPQPSTAWSNTSISITCNLGGLSTFTGKYVHVLTDSGTVVSSFAV